MGSKFKVGDRVHHRNEAFNETGVGLIEADFGDGTYSVRWNTWHGVCCDPESDLVAVAPQQQLTIQAGRYYRTRDGRKVGPMKPDGEKFVWTEVDGAVRSFERDGGGHYIDELNLVAEWVDEPAVATTPTPTTGFTVPLCAILEEAASNVTALRAELEEIDARVHLVEFSAHSDELTIADIVRRLEALESKPPSVPSPAKIRKGDLVTFNRPGLVTGVNGYTAHVQTDGGNYSVPLAALRAA